MKIFEKLALVRCEMERLQNEVSSKNCEIENLKEIVKNLKNASEKISHSDSLLKHEIKRERIMA